MRWLSCLAVLPAVLCAAGCAAPSRTADPAQHAFQGVDETQRDWLWEAAEDVLRENRFDLDVVDRRSGLITTHPVTSQQFFEPWRHDVDTAYDLAEASLRTVRRRVTVQFDNEPPADQAAILVTVHRELFATPERQFNNSLAAFQMFGEELPAAGTGRPLTEADDYWIEDGRDPAMERYLLERIVSRAAGT